MGLGVLLKSKGAELDGLLTVLSLVHLGKPTCDKNQGLKHIIRSLSSK